MLNKIKLALRTAAFTVKHSIWTILLMAFPYTTEIVATVEQYMPALAKLLPPNVYAFIGVVIVATKFSIQVLGIINKIKSAPRASGS